MATRQLPDADLLRKLLRYDPETGKLYWRERTPDMFKPGRHGPEAICRAWNKAHAGQEAFCQPNRGYMTGGIHLGEKLVILKAHRIIWCIQHGYWPDQIDHINQDKSDNRLMNLRLATTEQNARNCRLSQRNKSGRIGVHWRERAGKWRARIMAEGRYVNLGEFASFEDACAARAAAERLYGYSDIHGSKR